MTGEEKIQAFHVGAHKTGTSLVQRILERCPEAYRDHGVDFVIRDEMSRLVSWGKALTEQPDLLRARLSRFRRRSDPAGAVRLLREPDRPTVHRRPAGPLSGCDRRNLAALAQISSSLGAAMTTKVFLSIRRQSEFLESYYLQSVHEGSSQAFGDWLDTVDLSRLSWRPIVSAMVELFGPEQVEVVDFGLVKAGQGGYIGRFMRVLDPDFDDRFDPPKKYNRSVSEKGLRMALAANPFIEGAAERRRLRKFLQSRFSNVDYPRPELLSPDQAAEIDAPFAAELGELGAMNSFDRGLVTRYREKHDRPRAGLVRPAAELVLHVGLPHTGGPGLGRRFALCDPNCAITASPMSRARTGCRPNAGGRQPDRAAPRPC